MPRPHLAAVCSNNNHGPRLGLAETVCRHGRQRMNRTSNGQNDPDHSELATTRVIEPLVRHCTSVGQQLPVQLPV